MISIYILGFFMFLFIWVSFDIYKRIGLSLEGLITIAVSCAFAIIIAGTLISTGTIIYKDDIIKVNNEYIRNIDDGFEYYVYDKNSDVYESREVISNKIIEIIIDKNIKNPYLEITKSTHLISTLDEVKNIKLYTNQNDATSNNIEKSILN